MALRNPLKLLQTFQALKGMMLFIEGLKEAGKPGGPANPFDKLLNRGTGGSAKLKQEYRLAKQETRRARDADTVARRTYNDKQHLAASRYWTQKKEQERFGGGGRGIGTFAGAGGRGIGGGGKGGGGRRSRRDPLSTAQKLNYMEKLDDIRTRFPREVLKEKSRQRQIDRDYWDRRRIWALEEKREATSRGSLSQPPTSIPRTSQTAYDAVGEYNESIIEPLGDEYSITPMELLPDYDEMEALEDFYVE